MGGLGHFLESEGIATTQISLIREHTEIIKPPRALWVSFPLGRPLGNPNDPEFQKNVLKHALKLLEYEQGPVLEDFPYDAKDMKDEELQMACPVSFVNEQDDWNDAQKLCESFRQELNRVQTWYALACERRNRSTMGISGRNGDEIGDILCSFICEDPLDNLLKGDNLADVLRMAAEDLRTLYLEGVSAQPGRSTDPAVLADWFWAETYGALVINEVRKKCLQHPEKEMLLAGKLLLVPRNQLHRFSE